MEKHIGPLGRFNPRLVGWQIAAFDAFMERREFCMIHTREHILVGK
jgi:hypothetical protein